jgi:hypothetical protein
MSSPIDDVNEDPFEMNILSDDFDDGYDIGANDDPIKDDDGEQNFDENLIPDSAQEDAIAREPEEPIPFDDDEEKDSNGSGLSEGDPSDVESRSSSVISLVSR